MNTKIWLIFFAAAAAAGVLFYFFVSEMYFFKKVFYLIAEINKLDAVPEKYKIIGSVIVSFITFIGILIAYTFHLDEVHINTKDARFAKKEEIKTPKDGAIIGKLGGKIIKSDYHTIVCAPNRTGKGVSSIIPNLLDYNGSTICLDIKGENYAVTGREREKYGPVYVIDPFGVSGRKSDSFNWFDMIDIDNPDCISIASNLSEMITVDFNKDSYFDRAARAFLRGFILYVAYKAKDKPELKNFGSLRKFINKLGDDFEDLLNDMAELENGNAVFGVLRNTAVPILTAAATEAGKELSGVLNSARTFTNFLDDPRILDVLNSSTFDLRKIKKNVSSIYIIVPFSNIETSKELVRGLFALTIKAITQTQKKPKNKILFIFDEFAVLEKMSIIEKSISFIPGYGAQFLIYIQDLTQIKGVYSTKAGTFLNNANLVFFSCNEYETAEYISKSLGEKTIRTRNDSYSCGERSISYTDKDVPLMTTDDIMNLDNDKLIYMSKDYRPTILDKIIYYKDKKYKNRFDPNPFLEEDEEG